MSECVSSSICACFPDCVREWLSACHITPYIGVREWEQFHEPRPMWPGNTGSSSNHAIHGNISGVWKVFGKPRAIGEGG